LGISYPNIEDATRGLEANLITKTEYDKIVRAIKNKKMPLQNTKLGEKSIFTAAELRQIGHGAVLH
jgi:hypothetical protein